MLKIMLSVWLDGWFDREKRQINSWTDSISMVAAPVPLLHNREELPYNYICYKSKSSSMDLYLLLSWPSIKTEFDQKQRNDVFLSQLDILST